MTEGKIMKALSGFYYVETKTGERVTCRARGVFRKDKQSPVVGDDVRFVRSNGDEGTVTEILPRKNILIRPPISNIDQALIAVSVKEPDFSTALLDRFLVLIEKHDLTPVILLTKMDLLTDKETRKVTEEVLAYQNMGYDVFQFSTEKHLDRTFVSSLLKGKTTVIAGQSGVGKSSFLNALNPELKIKTAAISSSLGRGKHTTRHVELLKISGGSVADTPGFSSLEFTEIESSELPALFPDFRSKSDGCKYRGCMHLLEPNCAVKTAVDQGLIAEFRYKHYVQFHEEIKQRKPRY